MRTAASLSVLALGALVTASAAAAAPAPPQHVRGTVASATATTFTVTTAKGPVTLALTPKTAFAGVVPGQLADIKPGTFIGTANAPVRGMSRALEVVVFPDAMRGTGEGNYPWDLPAPGARSSSMTNGTVAGGSMGRASSMTNGTVSGGAKGGAQRTISVTYKGGMKQIALPANVPVVRVAPASKSLVKAGAHVFVVAGGTGSRPSAVFVVIGERGAVPPM